MKKGLLIALAALMAMESSAEGTLQPVCKPLVQENVPLQITSYTCGYQRRSDYSPEGIRHSLEYKNVSGKIVEAVEIGLVSFDVWNTFLDRTAGISIEMITPNLSKKGAWVARAYSDFAFLTGVAYVSKVRFNDGTIWSADLDAVGAAMREIEASFDVQKLKGREKPDSE
jgi:hypothetical protein